MTVYQIQYDLKNPGRNYGDLFDEIKGLGSYCHILDSTWLVDVSGISAKEIRKKLKNHLDSNDMLYVSKFQGGWATNFSNDCTEWLYNHV